MSRRLAGWQSQQQSFQRYVDSSITRWQNKPDTPKKQSPPKQYQPLRRESCPLRVLQLRDPPKHGYLWNISTLLERVQTGAQLQPMKQPISSRSMLRETSIVFMQPVSPPPSRKGFQSRRLKGARRQANKGAVLQ